MRSWQCGVLRHCEKRVWKTLGTTVIKHMTSHLIAASLFLRLIPQSWRLTARLVSEEQSLEIWLIDKSTLCFCCWFDHMLCNSSQESKKTFQMQTFLCEKYPLLEITWLLNLANLVYRFVNDWCDLKTQTHFSIFFKQVCMVMQSVVLPPHISMIRSLAWVTVCVEFHMFYLRSCRFSPDCLISSHCPLLC